MSKTKIDWCDFSWNPALGCRHRLFEKDNLKGIINRELIQERI